MRVADLLRTKGSEVATVPPKVSVTGLLEDLARHNVGALVVVDESGTLVGIVSERDVVRRLNERGAELLTAPVSEIMTTEVVTCGADEGVDSLAEIMTERRIRHMPVVEDGRLIGHRQHRRRGEEPDRAAGVRPRAARVLHRPGLTVQPVEQAVATAAE